MPEGGGGPRDRVGTLIRNKNLESNFLTLGIRFKFKVPHLSWTSTKSTKSTKSSQSASYIWIIISRSISKASFKMRWRESCIITTFVVQTSRPRGQHLCSKFAKIPHVGCARTFKVPTLSRGPPPPPPGHNIDSCITLNIHFFRCDWIMPETWSWSFWRRRWWGKWLSFNRLPYGWEYFKNISNGG